MAGQRGRRNTARHLRTAFAWTLWAVALLAFLYLLFRFVIHGDVSSQREQSEVTAADPSAATETDTAYEQPVDPEPAASFPADLAAQASAENAVDFSQWKNALLPKAYDTSEYSLYPGNFSADEVPLEDDRWIVVIDPGHQSRSETNDIWMSPYFNPQSGASWVRNSSAKVGAQGQTSKIYEYTITHIMAKKLKSELENRGFTVYLTKDDVDTVMTGPERAAVSNRYQADLVVSLHCDGYSGNSSVRGCLAQVPKVYSGYPDARLGALSALAGEEILNAYSDGTGFDRRGVREIADSSAFNWSRSPSVLLEMGFLTNGEDEAKLINDSFQNVMAAAIADGIEAYLLRVYAGVHIDELHAATNGTTDAGTP